MVYNLHWEKMMTNFEKLQALLASGIHPVVKIIKPIFEEDYLEAGMLARVTGITDDRHDRDMYRIHFSFSEFNEHNQKMETPNYYDQNHNPVLTATAAGKVPAGFNDICYAMLPQFESDLELVESKWFIKYTEDKTVGKTNLGYTAWLESRLDLIEANVAAAV